MSSGAGAHEAWRVGDDPLSVAWRRAMSEGSADQEAIRDDLIRRYSFAVPNESAVRAVAESAPSGVVEVGAGNGYWARLLDNAGVEVIAVDVEPAPSPENTWYAGVEPWFDVERGDEGVVIGHPDRALLVVWPTKNEDWPAVTVQRYAEAGGATVLYVGEGPGGRTGDDRFHALLGHYERCVSCAYEIATQPCICGVVPMFRQTGTVELPHWNGWFDDLHTYERDQTRPPLAPSAPRRRNQSGRRRGSAR